MYSCNVEICETYLFRVLIIFFLERGNVLVLVSAIRPYELSRINTSWLGYGCGFCDDVTVHGVKWLCGFLRTSLRAHVAAKTWAVNGARTAPPSPRPFGRRIADAQPGHRRWNRGDAREAHPTKVPR